MILVTSGTGKIGGRVTPLLQAQGLEVRSASRSSVPAFDWNDPATWDGALEGIETAMVIYYPDLAVPGASETVRQFATLAVEKGVQRLVLLSGRGEEGAREAEAAVQSIAPRWTILRASWFNQNFSESMLLPSILDGELSLPVGAVREPFVDADDIAEVAATVLAGSEHDGKVYELTGPRLLTFDEAVLEIGRAVGRPIRFNQISVEAFEAGLKDLGVPEDFVWLLVHLFTEVLDGRNESLATDVEQVLGRPARDFADYVAQTAATNIWRA